MKALVVEDDPKIVKLLRAKFVALRHEYEVASSLQAARAKLERNSFDYLVADLTIPADDEGDFPDKQYGLILIQEVRKTKDKNALPIIVMTSYVDVGFGLSTELHELGVNACVSKNLEHMQDLVRVISEMLRKASTSDAIAIRAKSQKLKSFSEADRELVIYNDAITVCGIPVWREHQSDYMRKVCLTLSEKNGNDYKHFSGRLLAKLLKMNDSNTIAGPVRDFRRDATLRLAEDRGLDCQKEDIICSDRGYHFRKWIVTRLVDRAWDEPGTQDERTEEDTGENEASSSSDTHSEGERPVAANSGLNERQAWILGELSRGVRLRIAAIVRHTKCNRSTINRDLRVLREKRLIDTSREGPILRGD